ncbi:RTA1 like protein-domain-containing protein [Ilyonectria sp. MPI-CAGE-AT-0026]|nr:RTA1 like protein-domain-containing protein [Ilyonectria sp. MPI-CAGE-AT-0026]
MAEEYELYDYEPSSAAAMIFLLAFGLVTIWHVWVIIRHRAWYFTPLLIGCIMETVGYVGRFLSTSNPSSLGPFMIQTLCLLVAPALFAASIYMVLGRLILFLRVSTLSPIKPTIMTKIFVAGDVISFLMHKDVQHTGKTVILLGLAVQIIFFGLFIIAGIVFHLRIHKRPALLSVEDSKKWLQGWRGVMTVLYVSSGLIFLMLGAAATIGIFHPAKYVPTKKEIMDLPDV